MKSKEDFERIYGILQADKTPIGEGCKALVLQDLEEKLTQYFDLVSPIKLQVKEGKGKLFVTLSFEAERVKKFNVLK